MKNRENIILNSETLNALPLTLERHKCLLPPLLFNTVLDILAIGIMQEEKNKSTQMGKKKVELSPFSDDMILYTENPKKLRSQEVKWIMYMNTGGVQDCSKAYNEKGKWAKVKIFGVGTNKESLIQPNALSLKEILWLEANKEWRQRFHL